jgi:beta-lactamase superfamily II metal-dependent hydrolase
VLARYKSAGSDVFRTDRDGQIEVTTDGKALAVETYRTSRR